MARLILDTSLLVATERDRSTPLDLVEDGDDVAIAAITAAELLVGLELADARRRPRREAFVTAIFDRVPIESYDLDVARSHAVLLAHAQRDGRPRGAHDLQIAATARARRRIVVTADRRGFDGLPDVHVRHADAD